jgi:acetyltransferase-like isoleucine patch superfamily enzyme
MILLQYLPNSFKNKLNIYKYKKKGCLTIGKGSRLENVHLIIGKNSYVTIGDNCNLKNCEIIIKNSSLELNSKVSITDSIIKCISNEIDQGFLCIKEHSLLKNFQIYNNGKGTIGANSVIEGKPSNTIQIKEKSKLDLEEYAIVKGTDIYIYQGASLKAGKFFGIGDGSEIRVANSIEIGEYVMVSYNVMIFDTNTHATEWNIRRNEIRQSREIESKEEKTQVKASPVFIGDDCWIGKDVKILKGVSIGDRSIIGAGVIIAHGIYDSDSVIVNPSPRIISRKPVI